MCVILSESVVAAMIPQWQEGLTDEQPPCSWVGHIKRIEKKWKANNS